MNGAVIGMIVVLVLLLVLVLICYIAYKKIRQKLRRVARMAWGTNSVAEGIDRMEAEYAVTPKSVSAATNLYLPKIVADFPEFHYEEMRERAENVLISFLRSIDGQNAAFLTEGTEALREKLSMHISMLKSRNIRSHYDEIKVHRTEIHRYSREKGKCSIVFQSAVEYVSYAEQGEKILSGRKDRKTQAKYNTHMIYIQDPNVVANTRDAALGLNCPNCGAPILGLGAKLCAYCDTPLVEFNIRSWNFNDVEEMR